METKFDITLEQAMELLNLKAGFTENEFKSNYKKLIREIHPDTIRNLNPTARKIIEDEAKRVNIAKGIIESFLKKEYSDYSENQNSNYYKRNSTSYNNEEQQRKDREYQQQQRKEREYKERERKEREYKEQQRKEREYEEQQKKERKKISIVISLIVLILVIIIIRDVSNQNNTNHQVVTENNQVTMNNNNQVENINTEKPTQSENISVTKPLQNEKTSSITLGSSTEEVKSVMGTPDTISDYLKQWVYGYSSITFDDNWKVKEWSNNSGNLKVTLGECQSNAPYITIGSTREDVIKSMGTPDIIYDVLKEWVYGSSSISFDGSWKVKEWSNSRGNLKVTLGECQANAPYITIGSTREDVVKSMGTPDIIYDILKEWVYGSSSISFDDSWKVKEWSNSRGNLKVK